MNISIAEHEELHEIRENVRRNLQILELCLDCERISECTLVPIDDGSPIWLCEKCAARLRQERMRGMGRMSR